MELVGHHQVVRRFHAPAFQMAGGEVEHVLKVDAILCCQGFVPRRHHRNGDVQEHLVAQLEGVGGHRVQPLMQIRCAQAVALGVAHKRAHQPNELDRCHGLLAFLGNLPVRVGIEHQPPVGQFALQPIEVVAVAQPVAGGFKQLGAFLRVKLSLPDHPIHVAFEVRWWHAIGVEREVLVEQVQVGVVEIGLVLPVRFVGGAVGVGGLVAVVDSV